MAAVKLVLRKFKRLANKIFGTKIDELFWEFRHIFDKKWAESYISKEAINHPHRKILIEMISKHYPFETVLEIGCASGPNLLLLAKKFPKTKFYGIDISKKAIETGRNYFLKENIKNVFLDSGKAENLKNFKDKSIDIIFTDATLIYEGPDKIDLIIKEMLRIVKKSIVLCEQHINSSGGSYYKDHWVYNYNLLFGKFLPKEKIKFTKIPKEVWSGDWGEIGNFIEIIL
jgi:ubiquinone/menaquinone biosynthesis C-methylase UbiE